MFICFLQFLNIFRGTYPVGDNRLSDYFKPLNIIDPKTLQKQDKV